MVAVYILGGFLVWYFIGCAVLAAVDQRQELFAWVESAPNRWLGTLAVILWPIMVYFYTRPTSHPGDLAKLCANDMCKLSDGSCLERCDGYQPPSA